MNAAKTSEKSDRNLMNDPQVKREVDRAQANRDELTARIAQAIPHDGTIEPHKGLHFNRSSSPSPCVHSVSIPAFCAIAFGGHSVPSLRAMPPTSTGSTSGSLVHHRCAMWSGCEKLLGRLLVLYNLLKMP